MRRWSLKLLAAMLLVLVVLVAGFFIFQAMGPWGLCAATPSCGPPDQSPPAPDGSPAPP